MAAIKHVTDWNGTSVEMGKARLDIAQKINSKVNPSSCFRLGLRRDFLSIFLSPAVGISRIFVAIFACAWAIFLRASIQ